MNRYFEELSKVTVPDGWYFDVRIEETKKFIFRYENGELTDERRRSETGAFIRLSRGGMWYTIGFSGTDGIAARLGELMDMALEKEASEDGVASSDNFFENFETNTDELFVYQDSDVCSLSWADKKYGVECALAPLYACDGVLRSDVFYTDAYIVKHFFSSKGSRISFDKQFAGLQVSLDFKCDNDRMSAFQEAYSYTSDSFGGLMDNLGKIGDDIGASLEYASEAVPVEPGKYVVVLSPHAAGIFAHESFGHKAEADFYTDESEIESIAGSRFSPVLSIVDDNCIRGYGYTPYDDEGSKGRASFIVRDGNFKGLLHSAVTAGSFFSKTTANARAVGYLNEPIVRMTNTVILPGESSFEDIIGSIEKGILVDNVRHGFGMSDFTIAPSKCYMIENGKVTAPVIVSVVTGNVDETLARVSMISDRIEIFSFAKGGCGKLDQFPLEVGFGGPYVKVDLMEVM